MLLKDFQFWLDKTNIPKDLIAEEVHWNNVNDMCQVSRIFEMETRCICSMFERLLKKYKTEATWKILIVCTKKEELKIDMGEVCEIEVYFDYFSYRIQNDFQKKILILDCLMEAIKKFLVYEERPQDIAIFHDIYKQIVDEKYINQYTPQKVVRKDKQYSVSLYCLHDLYSMQMYLILKDKTGVVIGNHKIIDVDPTEWIFADYLGELQWSTETEVKLFYKGGKNAACKAKFDFSCIIEKYEGK